MKNYITVIFLVVLIPFNNDAQRTTPRYFDERMSKSDNIKPKSVSNQKRTAQLINLINKVNENEIYKDSKIQNVNGDEGKKNSIDLEYYGGRYERDDLATEIMKLVQNNYDANSLTAANGEKRINIISNPEVLENYKRNLREDSSSSLSYDDSSDGTFSDRKLKALLTHLRRNAVFRLDAQVSENELSEDSNDLNNVAVEVKLNLQNYKDNSTPDPINQGTLLDDTKESVDIKEKLVVKNNKEDEKLYRKRDGTYQGEADQELYDAITKKYDWKGDKRSKKKKKIREFNDAEEEDSKVYKKNRYTLKEWNPGNAEKRHEEKPKKIKKAKESLHDVDNQWDAVRKTTKGKSFNKNKDWTSHITKQYENYKDSKIGRVNYEKSGALPLFGRTPIPYVGKRGIYEDK